MRRSFTLIELLAVTVIIGMTTAAVAGTMLRAASSSSVSLTIERIAQLDNTARLHARMDCPIFIVYEESSHRLVAKSSRGLIARTVEIPEGMTFDLRPNDECTPIRIDRSGRSTDYVFALEGDVETTVRICGSTGRVERRP
ncbi:MAG: prepilin-type N-terminal cleavage/methylation domain-containing protein [Planctomycetota bacterium]